MLSNKNLLPYGRSPELFSSWLVDSRICLHSSTHSPKVTSKVTDLQRLTVVVIELVASDKHKLPNTDKVRVADKKKTSGSPLFQ